MYNIKMKLVIDTSVIIAVLLNEPERDALLAVTKGYELIAPLSLPVEIGNAISLAFKRKRLDLDQGQAILAGFRRMRIQSFAIDYVASVNICYEAGIYAYDAYMIELAERERANLLTLDLKLQKVAQLRGVKLLEV